MKKNSGKKLKLLPIILIVLAIVVLLIGIVYIIKTNISKNKNNGDVEKKYTEYNYIESIVEKYNEKSDKDSAQISISSSETDITLLNLDTMVMQNGQKHMTIFNYTKMEASSIIYDKNDTPLEVVTIIFDENYNVKKVSTFDVVKSALNTYESTDDVTKYQEIMNSVSEKFEEVLKDSEITLFNKTATELKEKEYKK